MKSALTGKPIKPENFRTVTAGHAVAARGTFSDCHDVFRTAVGRAVLQVDTGEGFFVTIAERP